MQEREKTNFDHPDSIDFDLMIDHLEKVLDGNEIYVPVYDYTTHTRTTLTKNIKSQNIIVIEGLFSLFEQRIRDFMNIKVFVETDNKTRLARRIKRDMKYRQRTYDSIISQYNNNVKPMYNSYIEPSKKFCNIIIEGGAKNTVAMEQLISKITYMNNNII